MAALRWLFGDQLGPHFTGDHRGPVLLVESRRVLARRRFHRAKAHLVLSAMRGPRAGDSVEVPGSDDVVIAPLRRG